VSAGGNTPHRGSLDRGAAIFLGRGELVGRRLFVVALLVVAGSTLVGATR
jgi:hypothetical protein